MMTGCSCRGSSEYPSLSAARRKIGSIIRPMASLPYELQARSVATDRIKSGVPHARPWVVKSAAITRASARWPARCRGSRVFAASRSHSAISCKPQLAAGVRDPDDNTDKAPAIACARRSRTAWYSPLIAASSGPM